MVKAQIPLGRPDQLCLRPGSETRVAVNVWSGRRQVCVGHRLVCRLFRVADLSVQSRHGSSLPSSCLRNDVFASRLLTEHASANVTVLFIVLWQIHHFICGRRHAAPAQLAYKN